MRLSLLVFFVILNLASGRSITAQCGQATKGAPTVLSIEASAVQDPVKAGYPVMLKVTMTNKSNHDISVWVENAPGEEQYQIDVRDDKGNLAGETAHGKKKNGHTDESQLTPQDVLGSGGCATLKPGKILMHTLNVSKLYDLSKPGRYTIRLQRPDPESEMVAKSNPVTVTTVP